ncbi:uncharacterized protein LOC110639164 isoform X2 [Hevea brasiliensis]|uniref:uncharacterized protein LOC110639164 isoform X2 n=1 Tax=Hevea brasiliensis TaxID=3981 RepID=UPI000B77AC02|nr:uncharacterized protein LOC110639164 isoform X2 [Hevea brasiliensis]
MDSQVVVALALSLVGGLGTSIVMSTPYEVHGRNQKIFDIKGQLFYSDEKLAFYGICYQNYLNLFFGQVGQREDIMKKHRVQVMFSGIITAIGCCCCTACLFCYTKIRIYYIEKISNWLIYIPISASGRHSNCQCFLVLQNHLVLSLQHVYFQAI